MKRGDVAESDDRTRIGANGVVVDAVENAHRAVATACEEERVDVVRLQVMVQLCETLVVISSEVAAMAVIDVSGEGDAQPSRCSRVRAAASMRGSSEGDEMARTTTRPLRGSARGRMSTDCRVARAMLRSVREKERAKRRWLSARMPLCVVGRMCGVDL